MRDNFKLDALKSLVVILTGLLLINDSIQAQSNAYTTSINSYQEELNKEFRDPEESPLPKKDRKKFKELPFFPIDEKYRVVARFERVENATPFRMKTTTDRLPTYELYGKAHFIFEGKKCTLHLYQSHRLREMEEYKNHLFLPFTDMTNGETSYGGGRFLDLEIPDGEEIIIDFNKAYNPYCAYNHIYSCPIPPPENDLPFEVKAGVRYEGH